MSGIIFLGLRVLAAILLYAFVGLALYLMWRTLATQAKFLTGLKITPIRLEWPQANGETSAIEFQQADIYIGRDPECALVLQDSAVSARHTRLSFHHGHWWAEDMQSKNGTFLNENPLIMPTILTNGDTITCGDTNLAILLPD
jgi:pSer/pThr/pTyr-binding forkhead associated (FHA) protein